MASSWTRRRKNLAPFSSLFRNPWKCRNKTSQRKRAPVFEGMCGLCFCDVLCELKQIVPDEDLTEQIQVVKGGRRRRSTRAVIFSAFTAHRVLCPCRVRALWRPYEVWHSLRSPGRSPQAAPQRPRRGITSSVRPWGSKRPAWGGQRVSVLLKTTQHAAVSDSSSTELFTCFKDRPLTNTCMAHTDGVLLRECVTSAVNFYF